MSTDGIVVSAKERDKFIELTGKTPEQLKEEMAKAEAPSDKEKKFDSQIAEMEEAERKEVTGEDLDFDIEKFIVEGVVSKKNIKLVDGVYIDMQTLTQKQQIVADRMVKGVVGSNPVRDLSFYDTMEVAVLAMAITRMNNQKFPMPDPTGPDKEAFKEALERKEFLFRKLLDSSTVMIQALSLTYGNLPFAEALSEDGQKKS